MASFSDSSPTRVHRGSFIIRRAATIVAVLLALLALVACASGADPRPNVLWIVWDTARADHLGVYGYERDTTPHLSAWAEGARVYENVVSPAAYTLPSHASMFTGLLPSEHCTHNDNKRLDDSFTTIAELVAGNGYRTYLFSANPHVSPMGNLAQGFGTVEHPWSPRYQQRALEIVRSKLPAEDRSSELGDRLNAAARGETGLVAWNIKAAGELAAEALTAWLGSSPEAEPYFAFLNYMEAHRPYIPPRSYRERFMSPEQVDRSYTVDRSWLSMWEYTFGLRDYTDEELELTRLTYDASIAELDDHFAELMRRLDEGGWLENTIVILTSDHGEHLGEQHMLDHQYSLHEPLLRVPLIVHYPQSFDPGRDSRPVMSFDLFPTLLELTEIEGPDPDRLQSISLLHAQDTRTRLAEDPASSDIGTNIVMQNHPDWDPSPWQRQLRALTVADDKYIRASDGREQLYDLASDPLETRDLAEADPATADDLGRTLEAYCSNLAPCDPGGDPLDSLSPEERKRLESLGYLK